MPAHLRRRYKVSFFPNIGGERQAITQIAHGPTKRAARKAARENIKEEFGSDLWRM